MPSIDDLERALRTPAVGAGVPDLDGIRTAGRRLRTRRRARDLAIAGAFVVAVGATGTALLQGQAGQADGDGQVAVEPSSEVSAAPDQAEARALLERCRTGNQSPRATRLVFRGGGPTIKAVARSADRTTLAVESAGHDYWAHCTLYSADQELPAGMKVWATDGTATDTMYSFSSTTVTWVDRLPSEVAAVDFTTSDGVTTRIRAVDGYVAFDRTLESDAPRADAGADTLSRVVYRDADGEPIAAQVSDGSGGGADHERLADVPPLSSYPSQHSPTTIY